MTVLLHTLPCRSSQPHADKLNLHGNHYHTPLRSILQVRTLTCACTHVCSHSNLTRMWWESHTTATDISDISNDFCWTSKRKEFSNLSFPFSAAWNSYIFSVCPLRIPDTTSAPPCSMFQASLGNMQHLTSSHHWLVKKGCHHRIIPKGDPAL